MVIRSDDPLYPCSVLADRFLPACYQMQTSVIMYMTGQDVDATARVCLTAPEMYRSTCFQSLGRDISALTVQDHPRAIRLCDRSPTEFQPFCHLGYSKNLVDLTADLTDGIEYCRLLQSGDSKRVCYTGVGEQAWVLHSDPGTRANACASVEVDYVQDCRRGAGLVEDPQSASSGPIEAPANLEHPRIADRMRRAASPPG